ncbi:MAG TPA: hypothetical protein VGM03_25145 [Phycisphaerae bacterium]|jgi:acetyl esterase/lipase
MSKSKHGPALFEVIRSDPKGSRAGKALAPAWWNSTEPERPPASEPAPMVVAATPTDEPTLAPTVSPTASRATWIEIDGGRLKFALGTIGGAVLLFAFLVVVATAYSLGSRSGRNVGRREGYQARSTELPERPIDEIDAARNKPIDRSVFNGIGSSPVATSESTPKASAARPTTVTPPAKSSEAPTNPLAAPASGTVSGWVKGRTYVAVQHFQESRDDAVRAQQFLKDKGIESEVVELGKRGKFTLIATRGFDQDDAAQKAALDQYWKKIQSIGQGYWKAGGRYKLDGQLMTLNKDQW